MSDEWGLLVEKGRELRARYRASAPAAGGVMRYGWVPVIVTGAFLVLATIGVATADAWLDRVLAVAGVLVAGGLLVWLAAAVRAGRRMLRVLGRLVEGGRLLDGRLAALAELDWQDQHRWGALEYFQVGRGLEREGFRQVVSGTRRSVPVLVTVARDEESESHRTSSRSRTRIDRSAVYAARPGSGARLLRPEHQARLTALGFVLHVGPYGLCASAPSTDDGTVEALEEVLALLTAPDDDLWLGPGARTEPHRQR
jgi:hypothetical protein